MENNNNENTKNNNNNQENFDNIFISEYTEFFNTFDRDKDGKINKPELNNLLKTLNIFVSDSELNDAISEVDIDDDKKIEFKQFLHLMETKFKKQIDENNLILAFENYDQEKKGIFSKNQFRNILKNLKNITLSDEEINNIININLINNNNNDSIDYINFIQNIVYNK